MTTFTKLETAVLRAIFEQHPGLQADLQAQFALATVVSRENTGAGFFTHIRTPATAPRVDSGSPIGDPAAQVAGLTHGMGFALFLEDGRMSLLDGYARAGECTSDLDFSSIDFRIDDGAAG